VHKGAHNNSLSALLVGMDGRDRQLVQEIFHSLGWRLFEAQERPRAMQFLEKHPVQVVITEAELPNWSWKKVLGDLRRRERPPQLIVTSRHADDYLWAEALNVGAYDVLAQPFEREEVARVVASAGRHFEVEPKSVGRQANLGHTASVA
jgi:CheY-like chemotaxis protein